MDIIAMQTANKVLRRMNREFNGMYEVYVAEQGQTVFETSKAHDTEHHGLHVYVNGFHAVEGSDYTHLSNTEVKFKKSLNIGDVVLLTTQVVGIPKVEGEAYDDTEVQAKLAEFSASIAELSNKITGIIAAIDEDGDGEILDTIADLKAQWEDADDDLKALINAKASLEQLQTIEEQIDLKAPMSELTTLQETVANKAEASTVTVLAEKVQNIEANSVITDEVSGRPYILTISDGTLTPKLNGTPSSINIDAPTTATADGSSLDVMVSIDAGCDEGQAVDIIVERCELLDTGLEPVETLSTDPSLDTSIFTNTNFKCQLPLSSPGDAGIKVTVKRQVNNYVLATALHQITLE